MAEVTEFFAHFPQKVSKAIEDYVTDNVLLASRYLFVRREKRTGIQIGYCTHCRKEYVTDGSLKHNKLTYCDKCGSHVQVKGAGMGRKFLQDDAYFVWYEKSRVNPDAIIALGIYVLRDYSGDYRKTETLFNTVAMYLFEPGRSRMLRCNYFGDNCRRKISESIVSECENSMKNKRCFIALKSVESAVQGTPFQYSTWRHYVNESYDLVRFFDLAARYKCIEFLTKVGLHEVVNAKLLGRPTYGAINWRGETPEKVLRLTKSEIKAMRKVAPISPRDLRSYQLSKQDGSNLNWEEALAMSTLLNPYYSDELKKLLVYAPIGKIKRYFAKQMRREKSVSYLSGSDVLIAWRDYIRECKELGMDLKQEHVLFPNNLYAAHQKTTERVQIKADKSLNTRIAKRLKSLEKYTFEYAGLILKPAKDTIELFREGKALNHCVGQYSQLYAEGKSNLFFIRRVSDPNTSFYTVEIVDNKIIQVRGFKNCSPTDEVERFIEVFTAEKLRKKPKGKIARSA